MKHTATQRMIYGIGADIAEFFIGGWMAMFALAYVHEQLQIGRATGYWVSCVLGWLFRRGFIPTQKKDEWLS